MRYTALRKSAGSDSPADDARDSALAPEVPYAAVLPMNGKWTSAVVHHAPREGQSGACACEACLATRLAGLAIRFY